jgi:hypothetical protein
MAYGLGDNIDPSECVTTLDLDETSGVPDARGA